MNQWVLSPDISGGKFVLPIEKMEVYNQKFLKFEWRPLLIFQTCKPKK